MRPVRPIPPIVAHHRSGSDAAVITRTLPSASSISISLTWAPNVPSTWWPLPWTSLAIAPPTVTNRVPGRHRHEPPLRDDHPQQIVEAHPGVDRDRSRVGVEPDRVGARLEPDHRAAAVLRWIAVRTSEATGDGAPRADLRQQRVGVVQLVGPDVDHRRHAGRGAAPTGEGGAFGLHRAPEATNPCRRISTATRHRAAETTEHLAEADRQEHLQRHVADEPRQLRELASGVVHAPGARRGEVGPVDRQRRDRPT